MSVKVGRDRWVLLTRGPRLGPAVLFWGVLLVIMLLAIGLGRITWTPLRTRHWTLLGIGLSQIPIGAAAFVVGWLIALGARRRLTGGESNLLFNSAQIGLGALTLIAMAVLFYAVRQGLLGLPDMQIAGNASSAYDLNWYQDRSGPSLPKGWLLTVPLFTYRLLMLAWALWLAHALLGWLRWGWECFSSNGLWQAITWRKPDKLTPTAHTPPQPQD